MMNARAVNDSIIGGISLIFKINGGSVMIRSIFCSIAVLLLVGCQSIPANLDNKLENLTIKMQNGEDKKVADTGWYKARKKILGSGLYQMVLAGTSRGGFYAINTPEYCPGIAGVLGTPLLATDENEELNSALINKSSKNINDKINRWLETYSPELLNACNLTKVFHSVVRKSGDSYVHYIKSLDDKALNTESFNLFFMMEQGKEKLLVVITAAAENSALYTLKGERLCQVAPESQGKSDMSVEGLIKLIEGKDSDKSIPVVCFGEKKGTLDLTGMKLSSVLGVPEGNLMLSFEDRTKYSLKFIQFTDDPSRLK
jgi:hypothetical protein